MVDFEKAQANAFIAVFHLKPQGCFFHFWQALTRRLQQDKKLSALICSDFTFEAEHKMKCFSGLALIKPWFVSNALKDFLATPYMQEHCKIFSDFINYFQRQWSGEVINSIRVPPINKIKWNQWDAIKYRFL